MKDKALQDEDWKTGDRLRLVFSQLLHHDASFF